MTSLLDSSQETPPHTHTGSQVKSGNLMLLPNKSVFYTCAYSTPTSARVLVVRLGGGEVAGEAWSSSGGASINVSGKGWGQHGMPVAEVEMLKGLGGCSSAGPELC